MREFETIISITQKDDLHHHEILLTYLYPIMKMIKRVIGFILLIPIYFYKWFISPVTGPSCRHTPSCSSYAVDAIKRVGPVRGLLLGTDRILRCRPGGTFGYDPAPLIWVRRYRVWNSLIGRWQKSNRLK